MIARPNLHWRAKSALAISLIALLTTATFFRSTPETEIERTVSLPATVCPKLAGDARNSALLPSPATGIKQITTRKQRLVKARSNPYLINNNSLLIAGSEVTSAVIRSKSGSLTSATTCLIGSGEQWFVGGSAALGSSGKLLVVNSGLGTAMVEIQAYSSTGKAGSRSLAIAAVSEREIRLDLLAPGEEEIAVQVVTKSGRVSAFLFDERKRGLRSLGGDFVGSSEPNTRITIPAIPVTFKGNEISDHKLRIVAAGARSATIEVELLSDGSRFTPVGLSNVTLEPGVVKTLRLPKSLGVRPASLLINSTEPVVASVISQSGNEFSWSSPAMEIKSFSINLVGLEPILTFAAKDIDLTVKVKSRSGEVKVKGISGEEMVNWRVPANSRLITITSARAVSIGASWSTSDGFTSMPLNPGTELERSSRPQLDLDALFD
jgi:hypothetical protein